MYKKLHTRFEERAFFLTSNSLNITCVENYTLIQALAPEQFFTLFASKQILMLERNDVCVQLP